MYKNHPVSLALSTAATLTLSNGGLDLVDGTGDSISQDSFDIHSSWRRKVTGIVITLVLSLTLSYSRYFLFNPLLIA